jgi:hypothetical protein
MTDLTTAATTRARWQRAAAARPAEQYRPVLAKAGSERVERRTLRWESLIRRNKSKFSS